jgi:hypothetical protein
MKYLRKYNESKDLTTEIREFCEVNLSYLIDEGLNIILEENNVILSLRRVENQSWIFLKDHIIPFLIRLKKEYVLVTEQGDLPYNIEFTIRSEEYDGIYDDYFDIDQIIDEKVDNRIAGTNLFKIRYISFCIKRRRQ